MKNYLIFDATNLTEPDSDGRPAVRIEGVEAGNSLIEGLEAGEEQEAAASDCEESEEK